MSGRKATTFEERQKVTQQHERGATYAAIADACGWTLRVETVRKHCQTFERDGQVALQPRARGPKPQGPLSTFDPRARFAALRLKREHPAWGPAVIVDELHHRWSTRQKRLPHGSQVAAYFQQFGPRLVQPRRHVQLPPASEPSAGSRLVFQLDMQERLHLPQLGYFNVLNIRAPQWGLTVGCSPHPAGLKRWSRKVSQVEARNDCRQTFARWGLPDEVQTDRDTVLVPSGDYPFPSFFTLWLVGLGIHHTLIQRVTQNGSVERAHRPFDKQMLSGCQAADWPGFLKHVERELIRLNERSPSRAKACRGQVPLVAHPEARWPRRSYRREHEGRLFDMQRVYAYLARGRWLRQASTHSQFSFADVVWNAGQKFENQPVVITFTAETHEFILCSADGQEIKRMPSDWLTEAALRGLSTNEVVKVRNSRKTARIRNYRNLHPIMAIALRRRKWTSGPWRCS
jgi:hypothetical protein